MKLDFSPDNDYFSLPEQQSTTHGTQLLNIDETQFIGGDGVDFTGGVLLDNQSSTTVMKERLNGMVRDIQSIDDVLCIHTNAGTTTTNQKGKFLQLDSWYNPRGIANIISQAEVVDNPAYDVDYVKPSKKGAKDEH